jgi:hypothetical protein
VLVGGCRVGGEGGVHDGPHFTLRTRRQKTLE